VTAVRELSTPAAFAVMFGSAFALLTVVALWTQNGQRFDASTLGAFDALRSDAFVRAYGVRDWLTGALLVVAAVAGVEALVRRAWRAVAASVVLIGLSLVASFAFKAGGLLERAELGDFAYSYNTFPSGHVAAALAAVVAVAWLNPRWMTRTALVVIAVACGAIAVMSLLSFAHRLSDVLGGVLLTGAIAFAITAVVAPWPRRRPDRWVYGALGACAVGGTLVGAAMLGASVPVDLVVAVGFAGCAAAIAVVVRMQHPMSRVRQAVSRDSSRVI
jgi:membrane-associated phospholipid phosphatase